MKYSTEISSMDDCDGGSVIVYGTQHIPQSPSERGSDAPGRTFPFKRYSAQCHLTPSSL